MRVRSGDRGQLVRGERSRNSNFKSQLLLTSALTVPMMFGYGRGAYAACVNTGGSSYLCSGAETAAQSVNATNANVSFAPGATIDTTATGGTALTVSGAGELVIDNSAGGAISAAEVGISITATGDDGGTPGSISITSAGDVTSGRNGINATQRGTGDTSIVVTGEIDAGGLGLSVNQEPGSAGAIYISTAGINSNLSAISVDGDDVIGDTTIKTSGPVVSNYFGVNAFIESTGDGDVVIETASSVNGIGRAGIRVDNRGASATGDTRITADGPVSGSYAGIRAQHSRGGSLVITAVDATATAGDGIYANTSNTSATDTLSVTSTGTVEGTNSGIRAIERGTGGITINANNVAGATRDGIYAEITDRAATGDLTITATGSVQGQLSGIHAYNRGFGNLTVNAAHVTAQLEYGIYAATSGAAGSTASLSITSTGLVSGSAFGIDARHQGGGALTIDVTNVTSTSVDAVAGRMSSPAATGALAVTTRGEIRGNSGGIDVRQSGLGAVSVDALGDVTGSTGVGIRASISNAASTSDLTITATGNVQGETSGIIAEQVGGGDLTITANDVTGSTGFGVSGYISDATSTGDIKIKTTGDVESVAYSVRGVHLGTGNVLIDVANVTGNLEGAIFGDIRNTSSTGDLTITTTDDSLLQGNGILARQEGLGALTVNVNRMSGGTGIRAMSNNAEATGDLTITASGDIRVSTVGIDVDHHGRGNIVINANDVTSTIDGTTETLVNTSVATAIAANHYGQGDIVINANNVTSTSGRGIFAEIPNATSTGDIKITTTGDVQALLGVTAKQYGMGGLSIHAVNINSSNYHPAILADIENESSNSDITITMAENSLIQSGGILARQKGLGGLTIDVHSMDFIGIEARSNNTEATGDVTITVRGDINAVNYGIIAQNYGQGATLITIEEGASVSGQEAAISTLARLREIGNETASTDTVNLMGTLDGNVYLCAGDDTVNLYDTATITDNVTIIDGGDDTDTLNLLGSGTNTLSAGILQNFEVLQKSGSGTWTIEGSHAFTGSAAFNGGTFNFANGSNLTVPIATNRATVQVGGSGTVGSATLTGDFVQTADGNFVVDISSDRTSNDRLDVSGAVQLGGTVTPQLSGDVSVGDRFTFINAAGGATLDGATAEDSLLYDFEVTVDGTSVVLTVADITRLTSILDGAPGLTSNQTELATYLDNILRAGDLPQSLVDLLTALRQLDDVAALQSALNNLMPSNLTALFSSNAIANLAFSNAMMSCGVAGSDARAIIKEGQCMWAKAIGRYRSQDETSSAFKFDDRSWGISGGAQFAFANEVRVGFGLSYEDTNTKTDGLSESDGDRFQGGIVVKKRWGGTTLAATINGGYGRFETKRFIDVPTFTGTAESDQDVTFAGFKLRAAHQFAMGSLGSFLNAWYVRPQFDVNGTYVSMNDYQETGAGALNLEVADTSDRFWSFSPGIEFGGQKTFADGTIVRPWVRIGATIFDDTATRFATSFQGVTSGVAPFTYATELDKTFFDISAGLNIVSAGALEVRLNYDGRFSENSREHAVGGKVGVKF